MTRKLRKLDEERPYGVIYGMVGVAFEQDHIQFSAHGIEVPPEGEKEAQGSAGDEPAESPAPIAEPEEKESDVPEAEEKKEPAESLETMHYTHLKTMVESFGGKWTNKADAIAFLRGKKE